MPQSILMYLVQSESDIPKQPIPNTAYYVLGQKVVVYDNMNKCSVFCMEAPPSTGEALEDRVEACEKRLDKVFKYLTSFGE